jgi:hypothetical protein
MRVLVRLPASPRGPAVELRNYSGYDAHDLAAFVQAGLGQAGVRRPKVVVVTASPIYTRGCAQIQPDRPGAVLSLAIAAPSRFRLAKLARIVDHEALHLVGRDHGDMPEGRLYTSEAAVPRWARGLRVRYLGRAPDQLGLMGHSRRNPLRGARPGRRSGSTRARRGGRFRRYG